MEQFTLKNISFLKNSKYGLFFLTAILAAGQNRQGTIKTDLNLSSSGNSLLSFK
jgi:hypothetical protein